MEIFESGLSRKAQTNVAEGAESVAEWAVRYADALIAELNKEKSCQKTTPAT